MYFPLIEVSGEIRPLQPVRPPLIELDASLRTGFSREEAGIATLDFAA
jgi:hypothetical protein